jgi:hypothetical protein
MKFDVSSNVGYAWRRIKTGVIISLTQVDRTDACFHIQYIDLCSDENFPLELYCSARVKLVRVKHIPGS